MASAALQYSKKTDSSARRRLYDVIRLSAVRQLKTRYRGSLLGVLWSFANPILMTGLYTTLFGTAFSAYFGGSVVRYMLSSFVAVLVVTFFSQGTSEALIAVVSNGGLQNKVAIDPETFPIAAIVANTFQQMLTTFPLIVIVSAIMTHDPTRIVLTPLVLAGVVALVGGVGLALAAFFVFFRDLSHLWAVISFILWMTSPVFYPANLVPERIRPWFEINPLGLAIAALRDVSIGTGPIVWPVIAKFIFVAIVIAAAGHLIFRSLCRQFMDLL